MPTIPNARAPTAALEGALFVHGHTSRDGDRDVLLKTTRGCKFAREVASAHIGVILSLDGQLPLLEQRRPALRRRLAVALVLHDLPWVALAAELYVGGCQRWR